MFPWYIVASVLFLLLVMALILAQFGRAYLWYRKKGHPVPELKSEPKLFMERGVSGKLDGNWATANYILIVGVTENMLFICPFLPWAILQMYWDLGILHRIPIEKIKNVEESRGLLVSGMLVVTFLNPAGDERRFRLKLRNPVAFKKALLAAGLKPDAVA